MSNQLATPASGAINTNSQRISHGAILRAAVAPLKLRREWLQPISHAYDARREVVKLNDDGEIIALKNATTPFERFELSMEACEHLDRLPSNEEIDAVLAQLDKAISTQPTHEEYQLLGGVLLDGLAIKAGDDTDGYLDGLSYLLEDVEPDREEWDYKRRPRWIPAAALGGAVEELLLSYRATYGRPPPIADVVEISKRYRLKLLEFRNEITIVWNARQDLQQICNVAARDMDDIPDSPDDGEEWW